MTLATVLMALVAVVALGFVVRPRPLATPPPGRPAGTVALPAPVALPAGLPAPVARYYTVVSGGTVPRVDTFAAWGRARMRRRPLPPLPVTFWSEHRAGWNARQLLAVTWFGLPLLRGVDTFRDGRGEMRIGGRSVTGPEIDQGENLFMWAELALLPAVVVTRPEVRWLPADANCAVLRVPFGAGEDELRFSFDPDTGLVSTCRAMRYREPGGPKIGWEIWYERWRHFPAGHFPARIQVRWSDHLRPWFTLDVDGIAVNPPIAADLDRIAEPAA